MEKQKWRGIILFVTLPAAVVLVACNAAGDARPASPASLEIAQATLAAAQAGNALIATRMAQATRQEQSAREWLALAASATAGSVQAAEYGVRVQVTATAAAVLAAQTERADSREATREYISLVATEQAAGARAEENRRKAAIERTRDAAVERVWAFVPYAFAISLLIVMALLVYYLAAYLALWRSRLANQIVHTPIGPAHIDHFAGTVRLLTAGPEQEEEQGPEVVDTIKFTKNGGREVMHIPADWRQPEYPAHQRNVLRLLAKAMRIRGPESTVIPGYLEMQWSAATWTEAVRLLKPHVETKVGRNGGTFLTGRYQALYALKRAVENGEIALLSPEKAVQVAENIS